MSAYVGRNAILPVFTQLSITIGFAIGSSAAIEQVFQYQGIGFLLLAAIPQRDYTVLQAIFMIITISVIVSNLLADLLYSRLDPRITAVVKEDSHECRGRNAQPTIKSTGRRRRHPAGDGPQQVWIRRDSSSSS